jgi:hypothetical protein
MDHVVFYPSPDGVSGFRRFATLDEAVGFVEHLRNVEGVEDVAVHTLTPVPVAFRAYYKVEVPVQPMAEMPAAVADLPVEPAPEQAMEPVTEPALVPLMEPVDAAANGKRSLGFFAH